MTRSLRVTAANRKVDSSLLSRLGAMVGCCAIVVALNCASLLAIELDQPPATTQKPYSPADGQVVEITPPPFIWVPSGKGRSYVLQLSRSKEFPEGETQSYGDLKQCVFVPREPLAAGQWYWRYGVKTDDGAEFGRARPFSVSDSARPFPFPDWDEVIQRVPVEAAAAVLSWSAIGTDSAVGQGRAEAGDRFVGPVL